MAAQRWQRTAAAALLGCAASGLSSCGGGGGGPDAEAVESADVAGVGAEIVQLRRDQVMDRVQVALRNTGPRDVVVRTIRLQVNGFALPGPVAKDSPLPAGQTVNFPVPYSGVECREGRAPDVGDPLVTVRLSRPAQPRAVTVRLRGQDPSGLLERVAARACAVEEVARQVDLRFDDRWRLATAPDGTRAYGTLRARLVTGPSRDITQVAGAIMYGLAPDGEVRAGPLAALTTARPEATIPVVVWAARCDAHVKGEIKKPYEFLVWLSEPGEDDLAVTPQLGEPTKAALRHVCAF